MNPLRSEIFLIFNTERNKYLKRGIKLVDFCYENIEPEIVVTILRKNLKDFELFKKEILNFLKR